MSASWLSSCSIFSGAQRRGGLSQRHGVDAVGQAARVRRFLGLLGSRVHILLGGRRVLLLLLLLLGVGGFGPDLLVVVVGLGTLGEIAFDVAISPRAALEEHYREKKSRSARARGMAYKRGNVSSGAAHADGGWILGAAALLNGWGKMGRLREVGSEARAARLLMK
jgi:hypothetical protein